jgi:hypothetical protein
MSNLQIGLVTGLIVGFGVMVVLQLDRITEVLREIREIKRLEHYDKPRDK